MGQNQFHAKLSASKTKEWMECPAQIIVDEYYPREDVPGQAARLGTAAHYLIERCLQEGRLPKFYEGRLIQLVEEDDAANILSPKSKWPTQQHLADVTFEVDEEMVEATTHMVMYIVGRCEELGLIDKPGRTEKTRVAKIEELVKKQVVRLETRTNLFPHRNDTGGTADVTIDAWPDVIEIVDYKNGTGEFVPVKRNPQLRTYGMGVAQVQAKAFIQEPMDSDYETVRMTICQPRHHEAPEGGIMYEEMSMAELIEWRDKTLLPAVYEVDNCRLMAEALEDDIMKQGGKMTRHDLLNMFARSGKLCLNMKEHKCWFCSDNMDYPVAFEMVQEAAAVNFQDVELDPDVPEEPDMLADAMRWIPFIETWMAELRKAAKAAAMKGVKIPSHKLIRKTTHLAYRDEDGDREAIIMALTDLEKVDKSAVVTEKLLTPTQAKALAKKHMDADAFKRFCEDYTYRPEGDIALVHETKKGTPYVPDTAADDFADVELDTVGDNGVAADEIDPWD